MKLSIFYCISFTFLGCIILYIGNKLPEYLRSEKMKKYLTDESLISIHINQNAENEIEIQEPINEKVNEDDKAANRTSINSANELVSLEEAIRKQEEKDAKAVSPSRNSLRKRRFLIFPEGSSLQLVFCLTYFTRIPIADIFYMGSTASLAWELPQDPYSPFKQKADAEHRQDKGPVTYTDVKGSQKLNSLGNRILVNKFTGEPIQPFAKEYYSKYGPIKKADQYQSKISSEAKPQKKKHKKLIINPVFAKRSADNKDEVMKDAKKKSKKKKRASVRPADIEEMHREQEIRKHLDVKHMDKDVEDFQRMSRYGLYGKLEKLILGMGTNGKECVLKALCEIGQDLHGKQGTFLEEILRVVFTLPRGSRYHADYIHYDEAHRAKYKCADIYAKCSFSFKTMTMK